MVPFGSMSIKRSWAAVLCGYLALGATIQALPGLELGGAAATGALVTLAAAATAIARPFAGRWADRGAPVARVGAALVAAGAVGHLLAQTVPAMAAARLLLGAGEGALFTGALVAVLQDAPAVRRGRLIGHFGLSMWGGLALGPVMATAFGDHALWFATAAALAAAALTAAAPRHATQARHAAADHVARHGAGADHVARHGADADHVARHGIDADRVARHGAHAARTHAAPHRGNAAPGRGRLLPPVALRLGVLLGLSSFGYGTLNAFVSTRTEHAGLALGLFAGAFVVTRALGSRLVDDYGPRRVARAAIAIEAVALPFVPHPAALIVLGAGLSLVLPALMSWLVELVRDDERGAAVGAITSCWDVGIALAGPLGGLSVTHAFAFAALAAAAGAVAPAPKPAQPAEAAVYSDCATESI
jgi:MFS family permease